MDTKPVEEKVAFIKAKDAQKRLEEFRSKGSRASSGAQNYLEHLLKSLAAGRADDPKAVAGVAYTILIERLNVSQPAVMM